MPRKRKLPAGMKLRGNVYHADFMHKGRRICKRLSESFERAKTLMVQLRAQVEFGEFDLKTQDYPWQDLRDEYLRYAAQTVKRPREYERDIEKLEALTPIKTVNQVKMCIRDSFQGEPQSYVSVNEAIDWHQRAVRECHPLARLDVLNALRISHSQHQSGDMRLIG